MEISIMKTNNWILGGLMAMAFTACTNEELTENNSQQPAKGEVVSVTAYMPGSEDNTRVTPTDNGVSLVSLAWDKNDSFTVIQGNAYTNFTNGDGGGNTFTGVLPDDTSTDDDNFYAVYPALSVSEASERSASVTVPFDLSTQTGALNASMTYMYASSSHGLSYQFKQLTAILKVNSFKFVEINDEGESEEISLPETSNVTKVEVSTQSASKVNGSITFSNTNNEVQATITGGTQNTISINYVEQDEDGTEIVKPFGNPVYIYLPPMAVENKALNFSVTVKDSNGDEKVYKAILEGNPESPIEAGSLYNVDAVKLEEDNNPYFSFTNNTGSPKTFTLKKQGTLDASLQYSLNGGGWLTWSTGVDVPNQGVLRLRGANKNGENYIGTAVDSQNYLYISITNPNNPSAASNENNGNELPTGIICSGDIRTLINYKDYENVNTASARFCYLFSECGTSLTDISGLQLLPNATMASSCYYGMFKDCNGLTSIPAGLLPATTLAPNCYSNMFDGCKGLKSIPEGLLPATTLAESCYAGMFQGCSTWVTGFTIPANLLPAGKNGVGELAKGCYSNMFNGCSKLTSIPEALLPATTLAESCYEYMFSSCSGLTSIPAGLLPAGKNGDGELAKRCYSNMFNGCSKLTSIPEALLPATTLAESCYSRMFQGCSGFSTIPERLLPATTLAKSCYAGMFGYCSDQRPDRVPGYGLSNIPAGLLPAGKNGVGQLAESCYDSMFEFCRYLRNIPEDLLPATTLAKSCYYAMFAYSYLETIPAGLLPAGNGVGNLAESCYKYMFLACKQLNSVPAGLLPATTLAASCYESMFSECQRLSSVPEGLLPATTMVPGCYRYMFYKCSNLQTVPANFLPATTLALNCYAFMFLNCSNLTTAPTLAAPELVSGCYYDMFQSCSKLKSVTMLATRIYIAFRDPITYYFNQWLQGVNSTGTLYIASEIINTSPDHYTPKTELKNVIPASGWNMVETHLGSLPGISNGGGF